MSLVLSALWACSGEGKDSQDDTPAPAPGWSMFATDLAPGMLLSGHVDSGELIMVGGQILGSGGGGLVRFDGTRLCTEDGATDKALWWIHGDGKGEWYAVGEGGIILHSVDGQRTREDVPTKRTLYGVFMSENQVIAVGGDPRTDHLGEVWVKDGGKWQQVGKDLDGTVFKVWDNRLVGENKDWIWDGKKLIEDSSGTALLTVTGRSQSDVWAVGGESSGTVMHHDGTDWSQVDTIPAIGGSPLMGAWTAPGEDVWVAGAFGAVGFCDCETLATGTWTAPDFPVTSQHFHSVQRFGGEMFFMGGNFFSAAPYLGVIARYGEGEITMVAEVCD